MNVAFTGHRPHKLPWGDDETDGRCQALKLALIEEIHSLAAAGADTFYTGCAEGVDTYCAEIVLELKKRAAVSLVCVAPCEGQERSWSAEAQRRYRALLAAADRVEVLAPAYAPGCMARRNRYLVDHADVLLAVDGGEEGGTTSTIRYAEKRGKRIIRLPWGVQA